MIRSGHLRELKEITSLAPFFKQAAHETQCMLSLLQPDGTTVFSVFPPKGDFPQTCQEDLPTSDILTRLDFASPLIEQRITCLCDRPLLSLRIGQKDRVDGILIACPFSEEKRSFVTSVAATITDFVVLARRAVCEWEKQCAILSAHQELYLKTNHEENIETICCNSLEVLLAYFEAEAAIFVVRNDDDNRWTHSFVRAANPHLSEDWMTSLASRVISMHDARQCPVIMLPEKRTAYSDLAEMGISSFISTTLSHEGQMLGIVALSSRDPNRVLSFDSLGLLESLKSVIALRLFGYHMRKFKERFLENAIHKIKTPIHSLSGVVEHLRTNKDFSREQLEDWLDLLREPTERLVRFARHMEKYTHLHKPAQLRKKVSLRRILQECVQVVTYLAKEKKVRIELKLLSEDCDIIADGKAICDAFQSLIENSLRFSRPGQTIYIKLSKELSYYQVDVIDEGPGIPLEEREAIFQEFVSIPRGDVLEGTGLGLAIAREIVKAHGGVMRCENAPNKNGSYFWIALPRTGGKPFK